MRHPAALTPAYCKMQTLPRGPVCLLLAASAAPMAVVPIPTAHSLPHIRCCHHRSMSQLSILFPSTDNLAFQGLWERTHLCSPPLFLPWETDIGLGGKCRPGTMREDIRRSARNVAISCEVTQQNFSLPLKQEASSLSTAGFSCSGCEERLCPPPPL